MEEKANILLIDDRPLNPDSCKNMLHLDGIQTFQAFSPEESIQIAERLNLSLCIIDVQMPEIDGIEIAKALHQHITIAEIPILFLISSFSEKFQLYSNEVIHGIDFVLKTIEPEIFQNKV